MTSDVLVHMMEPAHWRAALRQGGIHPGPDGFVHLSTPGLVHLPAQRLFPGRRDLALLVVDPGRLTAPVRFEPGHPEDPAELRFPHLYGALPTSSVVAVVPYRPPTPAALPAPSDLLGRALALYTSLPVRRAVGVGDVPGGVAVLDPDVPSSHDNNRLLLTTPVDAAAVEAAAEEVGGNAGWPQRAALLTWPGAASVAQDLAARGWNAEELVLMARRTDLPVPGSAARAEVVGQQEVHELWERSWRRGLASLGDRVDAVVRQLIGRERLNDRVVAVTDVAVRQDGRVVAAGQLRVDGATAAVESMLTEPAARGRGYADAVLARLLGIAAEAGCDLVVLEASGGDWPRHWYGRRGFEPVGSTWSVDRPA
ncbi:GNAT family N-acetyltransferase [Blastococcus capsensis]|uniref:GNAT family N-acetyltransferase n=1 Tax=Blastococcus capsensis TaxID=1564163 RepID=UPI00254103F8|nr:GNAT family N-acetyltransferase [Blastococcus capsensis]MDK3257787.1 GNAT family N-acetyltransferase [Blastococcus capsensis]